MSANDTPTEPTLQTLLNKLNEVITRVANVERMSESNRAELHAFRIEMQAFVKSVNERLDLIDIRLDRMNSQMQANHSEFLMLRADFKEWQMQLREHLPALK